ncbi:uncharacterized protein LOC143425686 [Xylocopa sonorina]|uniref:uncharacterized protein LOC143425686 n=1 Tax=Xylocopa sonorina TaxID=1818115 RepID=UPI00403AEF19
MATRETAYSGYVLSGFVIKKSDFSSMRNTCVDQFVCYNKPDKSNSDSNASQDQNSVCEKEPSSVYDKIWDNTQIPYTQGQICLCNVDSLPICDNALDYPKEPCTKDETCEKSSSSVYSSVSNETSSPSTEQDDSICETDEPPTCTCTPPSTCYNIVEESDPLVEELLKQLPSFSIFRLGRSQRRKKGINVWEQLIRLQTFDRIGRKNLITHLERLISKQTSLESICLEGLSLTPDEGVRLLLALYNCRKTMRYVYCWRAFEKMVGLAVDADRHVESRFYADKRINKCDWFRAIGCLEFLTILSVNYAYIATPTGDLLVSLAKKLGRNWHWLQLLCLKEEIVEKAEYGFIVDKVLIPDKAWRVVHFWAPLLKVQYAIIGIPQYDVHKKFFTRNTPVHTFTLSTGIDLRFQQPWYLDCTIKTLCTWYPDTLVYLCLQVWHSRQHLDNQLKKLFLYLPSLRVFEFVGEIQSLKTVCGMCCQIRSGRCNVCRVHMQLQDVMRSNLDRERWMKSIRCLMACFKCDFDRIGVKFDVDFYCA